MPLKIDSFEPILWTNGKQYQINNAMPLVGLFFIYILMDREKTSKFITIFIFYLQQNNECAIIFFSAI